MHLLDPWIECYIVTTPSFLARTGVKQPSDCARGSGQLSCTCSLTICAYHMHVCVVRVSGPCTFAASSTMCLVRSSLLVAFCCLIGPLE
jgi:hypothetical protein